MRIHRITPAVVTLALFAGMAPPVAVAGRFADVGANTPYAQAIEDLADDGVLHGQGSGEQFAPSSTINRAEFSKIIASIVGTSAERERCAADRAFSDIPSGIWYEPYVCVLVNRGIVSGYPDGTFHGERAINFVEEAKMLSLAFGQQPSNAYGDGEWYTGYAGALEDSHAIPPSIAALDASVTRAETAEMLWRLKGKHIDQPAKAVINIQHPELGIDMSQTTPQHATSCTDVNIISQNGTQSFTKYRAMDDVAVAPQMGAPAAGMAQEKSAPNDYSQTNVQVQGVDEADVVKTDGENLYIVRNTEKSRVAIVRAKPQDALAEIGSIDLTNIGIQAQEMYVDNGTLTVIGTMFMEPVYDESFMGGKMMPRYYGGMSRTAVAVFDVSHPEKPKQVRVLKFDGDQLSSRRIESTLYLVLRSAPQYWWGGPVPLATESAVPTFEDSATGKSTAMAPCSDVIILPRIISPQYLAVAAVPLNAPQGTVQTEVVLGSAENVYASTENLYVAATSYAYDWNPAGSSSTEETNIYRFKLTSDGVEMDGSGTVPGHLLNQFAMDERAGSLRVATTTSASWDGNGRETHAQNAVYVLDHSMQRVGSVEGIAPGETIYAARFMGKRAYLVTFKTVDPFFVVDLSEPRSPKVLGQLKIPGYSNYLHPYDDDHVIGIGKEVDASIDADKVHSDDAVYYTAIQGVKMSLFDVSDVEHPQELHKVVIGDRGTETPVTEDHKALLFEKDRNLLALPILVTKRAQGASKSDAGLPVFQGAYVFDVTLDKGFSQLGAVSHYDDAQVYRKAGDYWYDQGADIQRIVRIDDTLYTVSQSGVRSASLPDVREQGRMTFGK